MANVVRHDAITLQSDVSEEGFERFMQDELFPYFSERYRGPTRASRADLKSQSLLKDSERPGRYVWVTVWDGSPQAVAGTSFENARMMGRIDETDAMLEKLEAFGDRGAEKIMTELISTEVPTNT